MIVFACVKHATKLTRSGCGERHEKALKEKPAAWNSLCRGCPVGAAHLAGDQPQTWPDGSLIAVSEIASPRPEAPVAPRKSAPIRAPSEPPTAAVPVRVRAPEPPAASERTDPQAELRASVASLEARLATLERASVQMGAVMAPAIAATSLVLGPDPVATLRAAGFAIVDHDTDLEGFVQIIVAPPGRRLPRGQNPDDSVNVPRPEDVG